MSVLSTIMKKGGVGKTTLTTNIGQCLGICGKKVLLIDNDEQHNLTRSLSLKGAKYDISHLLSGEVSFDEFISEGIIQTPVEGVDIITSSHRLASISIKSSFELKSFLDYQVYDKDSDMEDKIKNFYDYVLIDCSPGLSIGTNLAIEASDAFILPTILRQYSIDGLVEMYNLLTINYKISNSCIAIIPNMVEIHKQKHKNILQALKSQFPENISDYFIPLDENIDNIVTENKILLLNKYSAKSVSHFINLIFEIFSLDEKATWDIIMEKKRKARAQISRKNFFKRKIISEVLK